MFFDYSLVICWEDKHFYIYKIAFDKLHNQSFVYPLEII